MPFIEYGNPEWETDSDAANAEAQRRAILTRDADAATARAAIWLSDLGGLTKLPAELAEIDGLHRLIVGHARTPDGTFHNQPKMLADVSALEGLTDLTELNLSGTQVADLTVLLKLPKFAAGEGKMLRFADTPAARADRHWERLAGLPGDRAARDVVLCLRGESPKRQPTEGGAERSAGVAVMASGSPVRLVEENGRAEVADAEGIWGPGPTNAAYRVGLAGVHAVATNLVDELQYGRNVDERLLRRVARYAEASQPEYAPVLALLESAMVMIGPMVADLNTRAALDSGVLGGLDHLVALHGRLGLGPAIPEVLPDLPIIPETPEQAAAVAGATRALADVIREAAGQGFVGTTVVMAINSAVDVGQGANRAYLSAHSEEETRRRGLWSWAIRMTAGLAQAMDAYGKDHRWSSTPAGAVLMRKLSEVLNMLRPYFSVRTG